MEIQLPPARVVALLAANLLVCGCSGKIKLNFNAAFCLDGHAPLIRWPPRFIIAEAPEIALKRSVSQAAVEYCRKLLMVMGYMG